MQLTQPAITVYGGDAGAEMVANGALAFNLTGWAGANWAWSAGTALHTAGDTAALTQAGTTATVGTRYEITYTVSGRTAGNVRMYFGGVWGAARTSNATFTDWITATATAALNFTPESAFDGALDNVSIKPVTGGEATLGTLDLHGALTARGGIVIPDGQPVSIGFNALPVTTTGQYNIPSSNIAIGNNAGAATTSGHITAVGYYAGKSNSTGVLTAFGKWAGYNNTDGHATFFGNAAGFSNTTGEATAMGDECLFSNTTGHGTAFGYYAGNASTTGNITALGYQAARQNTTGNCIALGHRAGYGATSDNAPATDTDGILIGVDANRSVPTATVLTNYIGIGTGTLIDKSNQVKLGNASITETVLQGVVLLAAPVVLKAYTVVTLPATAATGMVQGATAFVTDATAPTYLGALTGGGAVVCPVFFDGAAWRSH